MKCIFSIRIRQFHEYFYKSSKSAFESTIESIIFELTWSDALNYVHIFVSYLWGLEGHNIVKKSHIFSWHYLPSIFFFQESKYIFLKFLFPSQNIWTLPASHFFLINTKLFLTFKAQFSVGLWNFFFVSGC